MTTKEQIEVMQAYLDGKTIECRSELEAKLGWVEVSEPKWNWTACEYRIKPDPKRPRTWEEFCETHPPLTKEYYIDSQSYIATHNKNERNPIIDKNLLPNRQLAEAMLALCQLIQLRDCYNDGWRPYWSDETFKFAIISNDNKIDKGFFKKLNFPLSFKTEKLRDEFLNNFRELIEIAKPLI